MQKKGARGKRVNGIWVHLGMDVLNCIQRVHATLTWLVSCPSGGRTLCPRTFQTRWWGRPTGRSPTWLREIRPPLASPPQPESPTHKETLLTELRAHLLQVVQIVLHGVGEVHQDVKVQGPFGGSEHLHVHLLLLSWQKAHHHLLRRHLRLLKSHVDGLFLTGGEAQRRGRVTTWHDGILEQPH